MEGKVQRYRSPFWKHQVRPAGSCNPLFVASTWTSLPWKRDAVPRRSRFSAAFTGRCSSAVSSQSNGLDVRPGRPSAAAPVKIALLT